VVARARRTSPLVRRSLRQNGAECLPHVASGGTILTQGRYPSRGELAAWADLSDSAKASKAATPASLTVGSGCCPPVLVCPDEWRRPLPGAAADEFNKTPSAICWAKRPGILVIVKGRVGQTLRA
jgi:hypothetical protein